MQWGRWARRTSAAVCLAALLGTSGGAQSPIAEKETAPAGTTATLPAGTPVALMLDDELSSMDRAVGDRFSVTVLHDVVDLNRTVIPQGTTGYGEVTFVTDKGSFGKPGIIGVTLRGLTLGNRQVRLDGRYREEGGNNSGAIVATSLAAGVFAGFINGKPGTIPKGRELQARTGEDIAYPVPPLPVAEIDAASFALTTTPFQTQLATGE
jgi:hypothetical protein